MSDKAENNEYEDGELEQSTCDTDDLIVKPIEKNLMKDLIDGWPQTCNICKCVLKTPIISMQHYAGRKHQQKQTIRTAQRMRTKMNKNKRLAGVAGPSRAFTEGNDRPSTRDGGVDSIRTHGVSKLSQIAKCQICDLTFRDTKIMKFHCGTSYHCQNVARNRSTEKLTNEEQNLFEAQQETLQQMHDSEMKTLTSTPAAVLDANNTRNHPKQLFPNKQERRMKNIAARNRPVRTCKLAVTDLPSTADEPGLRSRFEQFGGVLELSFENDCAYVRYSTCEEAELAVEKLHNRFYLGSYIHVELDLDGEQQEAKGPAGPSMVNQTHVAHRGFKNYHCHLCVKWFTVPDKYNVHLNSRVHHLRHMEFALKLHPRELRQRYFNPMWRLSDNPPEGKMPRQVVQALQRGFFEPLWILRSGLLHNLVCKICGTFTKTAGGWMDHVASREHCKALEEMAEGLGINKFMSNFWPLPGPHWRMIAQAGDQKGLKLVAPQYLLEMPAFMTSEPARPKKILTAMVDDEVVDLTESAPYSKLRKNPDHTMPGRACRNRDQYRCPSILSLHDPHTQCVRCRPWGCDKAVTCEECKNLPLPIREKWIQYISHSNEKKSRRLAEKSSNAEQMMSQSGGFAKAVSPDFYCKICDVAFADNLVYETHVSGSLHVQRSIDLHQLIGPTRFTAQYGHIPIGPTTGHDFRHLQATVTGGGTMQGGTPQESWFGGSMSSQPTVDDVEAGKSELHQLLRMLSPADQQLVLKHLPKQNSAPQAMPPMSLPVPPPLGFPVQPPMGLPVPPPMGIPVPPQMGMPVPPHMGFPVPQPMGIPMQPPMSYAVLPPRGIPMMPPMGMPVPQPMGVSMPPPMAIPAVPEQDTSVAAPMGIPMAPRQDISVAPPASTHDVAQQQAPVAIDTTPQDHQSESEANAEDRRKPSDEGRRKPSAEGRRKPSDEGRRKPSDEGRRKPSVERELRESDEEAEISGGRFYEIDRKRSHEANREDRRPSDGKRLRREDERSSRGQGSFTHPAEDAVLEGVTEDIIQQTLLKALSTLPPEIHEQVLAVREATGVEDVATLIELVQVVQMIDDSVLESVSHMNKEELLNMSDKYRLSIDQLIGFFGIVRHCQDLQSRVRSPAPHRSNPRSRDHNEGRRRSDPDELRYERNLSFDNRGQWR